MKISVFVNKQLNTSVVLSCAVCPVMRPAVHLLILLSLSLTSLSVSSGTAEPDWNLWPFFTPLLGDKISERCLNASRDYMRLLQESFTTTTPLTQQHRNALQMFDSNGRFPFFHEGMLQDFANLDLCESLLAEVPNCTQTFPEDLRVLKIPKGNANGPGYETGCKAAQAAKYCHNYYQIFLNSSEESETVHFSGPLNTKTGMNGFPIKVQLAPDFFSSLFSPAEFSSRDQQSTSGLDPSQFINLFDLLLERNSHSRQNFF